jgi:hypothetical protein
MSEGWVLLLVFVVTGPFWCFLFWTLWEHWLTAKKGYGPLDAPALRDGPFRRWWGWGEKLPDDPWSKWRR